MDKTRIDDGNVGEETAAPTGSPTLSPPPPVDIPNAAATIPVPNPVLENGAGSTTGTGTGS